MKLPNADRALVELDKFTEYALNPEHPVGKHKARVFESVLGLTAKDAEFLQNKVREMVQTHEAEQEQSTPYGERFVIDFELRTIAGTAIVRTAWMIRNEEDFPRLTSCYVK